jgi:hypothetical protein
MLRGAPPGVRGYCPRIRVCRRGRVKFGGPPLETPENGRIVTLIIIATEPTTTP